MNPIEKIEWSPLDIILAICCKNQKIYFWNSDGASICDVPLNIKEMTISSLQWNAKGNCLLLGDDVNLLE